jgi:hypothetical protein
MPDPGGDETIRVAEAYPFDLPSGSYHFRAGRCEPLTGIPSHLRPVLAIGAGAAPSQLSRKFGICPDGLPVSCAIVHDYAVVFSAHFTTFGSLPATLVAHPGSACRAFVTWLTEPQVTLLQTGEGIGAHYDFVTLDRARVIDDIAGPLAVVGACLSRAGMLVHDRAPIRVAEVPTTGCPFPALTQRAVLRWVHQRLTPLMDYAAFISRVVGDASFRRATNVALRRFNDPETQPHALAAV